MSQKAIIEFDVAGQIEVDNQIVPNTGDYFTVKVRGTLYTSTKSGVAYVEKGGEQVVLSQIDGTELLQDLEINDVAEIVAARFPNEDEIETLIATLRTLV